MARSSKTAQKQAERATELWQASEQKLAVLEQQLQDRQPLSLPPLAMTPKNPRLCSIDTAHKQTTRNHRNMLFRLEAENYEEEPLDTMAHKASIRDEEESEPATTTTTTKARQEGSAPPIANPTQDQQPVNTTLLDPVPKYHTPREAVIALQSAKFIMRLKQCVPTIYSKVI